MANAGFSFGALLDRLYILNHSHPFCRIFLLSESRIGGATIQAKRVVDIAGYGSYVDGRKTLAQFLQPFVLGILETPPATHVNAVQKETWSMADCIKLHRKLNVELDRLAVRLAALAAGQRTSNQSVVQQIARKVQDARGEQTKLNQLIFGNHVPPLPSRT